MGAERGQGGSWEEVLPPGFPQCPVWDEVGSALKHLKLFLLHAVRDESLWQSISLTGGWWRTELERLPVEREIY